MLVRGWSQSVYFTSQGGAISILVAAERPTYFSGMVLISPLVLTNPESASTLKVRGCCGLYGPRSFRNRIHSFTAGACVKGFIAVPEL